MIDERLDKFTLNLGNHVAQAVQGSVRASMNDWTRTFDDYKKSDLAWKETAQPVIEFYRNMDFSKSLFIGVLKVVVLVGAATGVLWATIKYLK